MKMTLDQLRVDSYATQVSETELTEVKGGTWILCAFAAMVTFVEWAHDGCESIDDHPVDSYVRNRLGGL